MGILLFDHQLHFIEEFFKATQQQQASLICQCSHVEGRN
jgi:hypothetical protein